MRGVRKQGNGWVVTFANKYSKFFKSEDEAKKHRLYLEGKYGVPKSGPKKQTNTKPEILKGKKIGLYTMIGDTGNRDINGSSIALVKTENDKYLEIPLNGLMRKNNTGYIGSSLHTSNAKKNIKKMNDSQIVDGSFLILLSKEESNITNKTGYRGISWNNQNNKWATVCTYKGERVLNKSFFDFKDAVKCRNEFMIENFNSLLIENNIEPIKKINIAKKNEYVMRKEYERDVLLPIKKDINKLIQTKKNKMIHFNKTKKVYVFEARLKGKRYTKTFKIKEQAEDYKKKYIKTVIDPQIKQLKETIKNDRI